MQAIIGLDIEIGRVCAFYGMAATRIVSLGVALRDLFGLLNNIKFYSEE